MSPVHQVWQKIAKHSDRGKKTRQTEEEVGRQHQEMDRPGDRQVPEGSGEQGEMEKTDFEIICGAPTTLVVKGYIMKMMMMVTLATVEIPSSSFPHFSLHIWPNSSPKPDCHSARSKRKYPCGIVQYILRPRQ